MLHSSLVVSWLRIERVCGVVWSEVDEVWDECVVYFEEWEVLQTSLELKRRCREGRRELWKGKVGRATSIARKQRNERAITFKLSTNTSEPEPNQPWPQLEQQQTPPSTSYAKLYSRTVNYFYLSSLILSNSPSNSPIQVLVLLKLSTLSSIPFPNLYLLVNPLQTSFKESLDPSYQNQRTN